MITEIIKNFDRDDLAKKFAELGFTKGVEVGVRWGAFSKVLCQVNKNLELKSVDPYSLGDFRSRREGKERQENYYRKAKRLLKPFNCELVRKTSMEAVLDFPEESIDFVYIDGAHEFDFVMCDIIEWGKRVKKGGIISGHDYYNFTRAGIIKSVDTYCEVHKVEKLYLTDGRVPSWWIVKTW